MAIATVHTYRMVKMIDEAVGHILDVVSGADASDNTYILFTSDHGELLGDHGLCARPDAPWNETHWKDEAFDRKLVQSRSQADPSKRREIYFELQQIIHDECPTIIPAPHCRK